MYLYNLHIKRFLVVKTLWESNSIWQINLNLKEHVLVYAGEESLSRG